MIVHIFITILLYLVLMSISATLLGILVRSFFVGSSFNNKEIGNNKYIEREIRKYKYIGGWTGIVALFLIFAYFYTTFYFWNIGVTMVALVIMLGRLPDLLWEIKSGRLLRGMTFSQAKSILPNTRWALIANFLVWASLPALYFFLYLF